MLGQTVSFSSDSGQLRVSGWLRGKRALNPNHLVHLVGAGDFPIVQIDAFPNQHLRRMHTNENDMEDDDESSPFDTTSPNPDGTVCIAHTPHISNECHISLGPERPDAGLDSLTADEAKRTTLVSELPKTVAEAQRLRRKHELQAQGMSDFMDRWTVPLGLGTFDLPSNDAKSDEDDDIPTGGDNGEEQAEEQSREMLEADEMEFPNEVECPPEIPAERRFCKYQALEPFREAKWNPRALLPPEYDRIFQLTNFREAQKDVQAQASVGVPPLTHVVVTLGNVPEQVAQRLIDEPGRIPCVIFGLFEHENKVSVIHFSVRRDKMFEEPVQGKDPLIIRCGFRRFRCRPVWSEAPRGVGFSPTDKFLMERFLQAGRWTVGSCYERIMLGSASMPVLVFRDWTLDARVLPRHLKNLRSPVDGKPVVRALNAFEGIDGEQVDLVASGSFLETNTDRLNIKKSC
eukprot:GABV01000248.1.p1 GENE.GABV01000248.1~~GABV01000248.1.p1  ORF type:complete len:497 (-),score=114.57 GABV01000248.1:94-1470(-)